MKKPIRILLVLLVLFLVAAAAGYGISWYRGNHIFVEGKAYSIHARSLDLREEDISFEHYDAVHSQLPDCHITWMVPFQGGRYSSDSQSLTVTTFTQEDMDLLLAYFPDLKTLDASGCGDYALLSSFQDSRPECQVIYQVDLGGVSFELDATELTLSPGEYTLEALTESLQYLPQVTDVTLRTPELTTEELETLKSAYAEVNFACTVEILGTEYDTETTTLDLSALTGEDVADTAEKLILLPGLEEVTLTDSQGQSSLTKEEVKTLMDACPQAVFHYTFEYQGQTLSTSDMEVIIQNKKIGDDGETELRQVLDLLPNCTRFVLDNCGFSNEVLAQVREDYRDRTKVVWRVYFGNGSALTDVDVIRTTYDLVDDNSDALRYCEDVRFMDIGHNEWLDSVDFVSGMTSLEYVIVSGAPIKDLTPFANCKNLKFLEIAFCEYIEDVSPLAACTNLQMLNISNTHVTDLSALDDLPLTHFCAKLNPSGKSRVPEEEQERFIEKHPDCWTTFDGEQPYGPGWRYDEDGITPLPQYALIQQAFKYPNAPNNTGWYFDENEQTE